MGVLSWLVLGAVAVGVVALFAGATLEQLRDEQWERHPGFRSESPSMLDRSPLPPWGDSGRVGRGRPPTPGNSRRPGWGTIQVYDQDNDMSGEQE